MGACAYSTDTGLIRRRLLKAPGAQISSELPAVAPPGTRIPNLRHHRQIRTSLTWKTGCVFV